MGQVTTPPSPLPLGRDGSVTTTERHRRDDRGTRALDASRVYQRPISEQTLDATKIATVEYVTRVWTKGKKCLGRAIESSFLQNATPQGV